MFGKEAVCPDSCFIPAVFQESDFYCNSLSWQNQFKSLLLFFKTNSLGIKGYSKPFYLIKQGFELCMHTPSYCCKRWFAITPGVYLPPAPPESRLASIPVIHPRCVPDPPGWPPLSIDPHTSDPPIPSHKMLSLYPLHSPFLQPTCSKWFCPSILEK